LERLRETEINRGHPLRVRNLQGWEGGPVAGLDFPFAIYRHFSFAIYRQGHPHCRAAGFQMENEKWKMANGKSSPATGLPSPPQIALREQDAIAC
jgi:hypothetical protein